MSVSALLERQAALNPDRTAVVADDATLTYARLEQVTGHLAGMLYAVGARRTEPVAVLAQRGASQLTALLSILRTGAPYACVDTAQPARRIETQLRACGARILVTDRTDICPPEFTVIPARHCEETGRAGSGAPSAILTPRDLAYVMFTSGSTGDPKMVEVTHGGLVNYASFLVSMLDADRDGERALNLATVTSLATDLGNTAIYPALIRGDTVHVVSGDIATDPEDFAGYVTEHRIDVLKTTPSHLEALFDEVGAEVLPARMLIIGGEAAGWDLVSRVRDASRCRVVNHYGPTEATIGALTFEINDPSPAHRACTYVPIGWPIANIRAYVVDDMLRRLPPETEGELLIAGAGVARGYRGDAELTRERFPADPFTPDGAHAYRTGDVVRCLRDGSFEFLGRRDTQFKVRGHRVETGEIERALRDHPGVLRTAVVLRNDPPAAPRLVAYVVPDTRASSPDGPSSGLLRTHLRSLLPEYLVPATFVLMDSLPLTPSGKLDVRALPNPDR